MIMVHSRSIAQARMSSAEIVEIAENLPYNDRVRSDVSNKGDRAKSAALRSETVRAPKLLENNSLPPQKEGKWYRFEEILVKLGFGFAKASERVPKAISGQCAS